MAGSLSCSCRRRTTRTACRELSNTEASAARLTGHGAMPCLPVSRFVRYAEGKSPNP